MTQLHPHCSSSFDETNTKSIKDERVYEADQLQLGWSLRPHYIQLKLLIQAEQADHPRVDVPLGHVTFLKCIISIEISVLGGISFLFTAIGTKFSIHQATAIPENYSHHLPGGPLIPEFSSHFFLFLFKPCSLILFLARKNGSNFHHWQLFTWVSHSHPPCTLILTRKRRSWVLLPYDFSDVLLWVVKETIIWKTFHILSCGNARWLEESWARSKCNPQQMTSLA